MADSFIFNIHTNREKSAVAFREAAANKGIPFSHMVTFSGLDEATQEIREKVGEIDFVVFEPADELVGPPADPYILVYSPA